ASHGLVPLPAQGIPDGCGALHALSPRSRIFRPAHGGAGLPADPAGGASAGAAHVAAGVSAVPPRPSARAGVAALDLERAPTPSMAGMESFLTIEQMARRAGLSAHARSEEHTSELQSRENLVCRLLLEKKKK